MSQGDMDKEVYKLNANRIIEMRHTDGPLLTPKGMEVFSTWPEPERKLKAIPIIIIALSILIIAGFVGAALNSGIAQVLCALISSLGGLASVGATLFMYFDKRDTDRILEELRAQSEIKNEK